MLSRDRNAERSLFVVRLEMIKVRNSEWVGKLMVNGMSTITGMVSLAVFLICNPRRQKNVDLFSATFTVRIYGGRLRVNAFLSVCIIVTFGWSKETMIVSFLNLILIWWYGKKLYPHQFNLIRHSILNQIVSGQKQICHMVATQRTKMIFNFLMSIHYIRSRLLTYRVGQLSSF